MKQTTLLLLILSTLSLLILSPLPCQGQTPDNSSETFKAAKFRIYINASSTQKDFISYYSNYYEIDEDKYFSIGKISLACEWSRNRKFSHEIEWMPLSIDFFDGTQKKYSYTSNFIPSIEGEKSTFYSTYARYQYNYSILSSNRRIMPYIGVACGISFRRAVLQPYVVSVFPQAETSIKIPLEIVPGMNFRITDKLHLNLNVPVIINNLVMKVERIDNPAVTEELRKTTNLYGELMPTQFQVRLGIGYVIK